MDKWTTVRDFRNTRGLVFETPSGPVLQEPFESIYAIIARMDYSRIARRITLVLFLAQSLGSAGFISASTISSIVGADLSGNLNLAGVPAAIYQVGAALAAFIWGIVFDRIGRRGGITLGLAAGVVGAFLAETAVIHRSFAILLIGLPLMGAANSALQLGRFAAAEVHPPSERGRAISNVVIGGTVGAIVGPLMVGPTGTWASQLGLDELAGPYAASLILFAFGGLVVFAMLRPDPRDIGKEIAALHPESLAHHGPARSLRDILRAPPALVAMGTMVCGQVTMVMLMVITSLYMKQHNHQLSDVAFVISSHTIGMFAFSIFSGRLADRWGRAPVMVTGAGTLILACLSATLSPDVIPLSVALFLLGLGWNFCFVGGSSLLADQLSPEERARTQGFNDLLIGLVSASGGLFSGVIFANVGYAAMGYVGALVALAPIALIAWWKMEQTQLAEA